jgi:predicted transcriptional regulator YdeE
LAKKILRIIALQLRLQKNRTIKRISTLWTSRRKTKEVDNPNKHHWSRCESLTSSRISSWG